MRPPRRLTWVLLLGVLGWPRAFAEPADPTLALIQRTDAFLHRTEGLDGVTRDPRNLRNPPEEIRLSVIPQLLAYCELYRIFPRTTAYRDIVDRADFLLLHRAEATSGSAFDGMLALGFLEAHAVTGDARYRAAAEPYLAQFRAMRGSDIRLNGGLMAAMALAEDARATGSALSLNKVHEILLGVAREQNRDGSFPHYCFGTRDVHYSAWMAMEMILIGERVADPLLDGLLTGVDGFLSGRVDLAGATSYEGPGPLGTRAVFYSVGSGCPDYDTRGWTNELGYTAMLFDRFHDPRYHGVAERLRELQDDGAFSDKWDYPPGPFDPILPWASETHSVIRTSVIFWSLASLYAARGTHVPVRYVASQEESVPAPDEVSADAGPGEGGAGAQAPSTQEGSGWAPPADEDLPAWVAHEAPAAIQSPASVDGMATGSAARAMSPASREETPPLAFGLGPVYPNPALAACAIPLRLPQAADVRLRVFDGAGRLVRDLSPGPMAAGVRLLRWDGRDRAGARVAPGVYWLEARAGASSARVRVAIAR